MVGTTVDGGGFSGMVYSRRLSRLKCEPRANYLAREELRMTSMASPSLSRRTTASGQYSPDVLVSASPAHQAEVEAAREHRLEGGGGLCNDGRVVAPAGGGNTRAEAQVGGHADCPQ